MDQPINKTAIRAIIASQLIPPLMFSGVAVALPPMGADLHMGAIALSLVEIVFLASQLAFMLPMGKLTDALDKAALYKVAMAGFAAVSLAIAFTPWVWGILVLRVLQGLCSAIFASTGLALLTDMAPPEKRGALIGQSIGAIYTGLTFGPLCAGFLVHDFGWRSLFIACAALLVAGYLLLHHALPKTKLGRTHKSTVHIPSALLMILAVGGLVAASVLTAKGWPALAALAASALATTAFVKMQNRIKSPLVDLRALFSNHALRDALATQMLLYINAFSGIFLISLYIQIPLQQTPRAAGIIIALGSMCMAVAAPMAGRLADKYARRTLCATGIGMVLAAGLMALLFFTPHTAMLVVGFVLALQSLGFAFFSSPNMTTIMNSVPKNQSGLASSLGAKARSLGMVIGMLVTGALMAHALGAQPVAENPAVFMRVMHLNFGLLVITTALALWLCLARKRA